MKVTDITLPYILPYISGTGIGAFYYVTQSISTTAFRQIPVKILLGQVGSMSFATDASGPDQVGHPTRKKDDLQDIKEILRDFLASSGVNMSRKTPENPQLRAEIWEHVRSWATYDNVTTLENIVDYSCALAETAYGHISPEHQYFVALFTACFFFIDDLGQYDLNGLQQFAGHFARGETQLSPALESFTALFKRRAHALWTGLGADAMIASTLDAVHGMCIEYTTQDMEIKPQATWYPTYVRNKTGLKAPYAHFIFTKSWRATAESYLQMLPYIEFWLGGTNDILSFYKEELAGEKNYIHWRASAEQSSPIEVLRQHANEVLAAQHNVEALIGYDHALGVVWRNYVEGYLEFHLSARRYKLSDLNLY